MVAIDMVAMLGPWLHSSASRTLAEEETEFGWDKYANSREEHVIKAEYICVFLVLLITTLMLQFYVGHKWHITWLPEAGATVLLGMFISGLIRAAGNDTSSGNTAYLGFDSTVFFIGFLPPIIYNAGYSLKRRLFFANMGGIVSLAIIGTSFSAIVVGFGLYAMGKAKASSDLSLMEGLTFGSLISATDPVSTLAVFTELKVDPTLFYLVFGESVLNDAIAITLFKTFAKFVGYSIGPEDMIIAFIDFLVIFIGSASIGYVLGLATAYFFKVVDLSHYRLLLVSIFVCMVYVPFLFAESIQLSGIVTILFTSITTKRYINRNIPAETKRAGAFVFELLAYLSETAVFLFLGMAVFSQSSGSNYRADTIFWTLFLCLVGRLHVYPLLDWVNKYREKRAIEKNRRPNLIPMNIKHVVYLSGLRGAVAYALANIFPDELGNRGIIVATTMVIILLTIFINGGATFSILEYFKVDKGVDFQGYVDKLKKQAKPYKFLIFEQKYIYPIVVKGYNSGEGMDLSSQGGGSHHTFASATGVEADDHHNGDQQLVHGDEEDDNDDGVQLNPLQQKSDGFAPVVSKDEENGLVTHSLDPHDDSAVRHYNNAPVAYGDSDNLF